MRKLGRIWPKRGREFFFAIIYIHIRTHFSRVCFERERLRCRDPLEGEWLNLDRSMKSVLGGGVPDKRLTSVMNQWAASKIWEGCRFRWEKSSVVMSFSVFDKTTFVFLFLQSNNTGKESIFFLYRGRLLLAFGC